MKPRCKFIKHTNNKDTKYYDINKKRKKKNDETIHRPKGFSYL